MSPSKKKHKTCADGSHGKSQPEITVPKSESYIEKFSMHLSRKRPNLFSLSARDIDTVPGMTRYTVFHEIIQGPNLLDVTSQTFLCDFTVAYNREQYGKYLVKFTREGSPLSATSPMHGNIVSEFACFGKLENVGRKLNSIKTSFSGDEGKLKDFGSEMCDKDWEAYGAFFADDTGSRLSERDGHYCMGRADFKEKFKDSPVSLLSEIHEMFMKEYMLIADDDALTTSARGIAYQRLIERIDCIFWARLEYNEHVTILHVIEGYIHWIGSSGSLVSQIKRAHEDGTMLLLIEYSQIYGHDYANVYCDLGTFPNHFNDVPDFAEIFDCMFKSVVESSEALWKNPLFAEVYNKEFYGVACAIAIKMFCDPTSTETGNILAAISMHVSRNKGLAVDEMSAYKVLRGLDK